MDGKYTYNISICLNREQLTILFIHYYQNKLPRNSEGVLVPL